MKTNPHQPPSEAELDQLLGSQLTRTSPEFEQRWRELRNSFEPGARARRSWMRPWLIWPGLATAALAVALTIAVRRDGGPFNPVAPAPAFEELLAWDAALAPATPLLPAENREAILHLPAPANL